MTTTEEMSNQDENKGVKTQIVKPKIFNFASKRFSRYETNILRRDLKFTPTRNVNNIELKFNIHAQIAPC